LGLFVPITSISLVSPKLSGNRRLIDIDNISHIFL
jgi:hypothetical protein